MSEHVKTPAVVTASIPMGEAAVKHPKLKTSGMAIASIVCGTFSLFFFFLGPLAMILGFHASTVCGILGLFCFFFLSPLAMILGFNARDKIKQSPKELQGLYQANAGIVCGTIAAVMWIIIVSLDSVQSLVLRKYGFSWH